MELDGGQLRYLTVSGVEVLRAVSFLVRDENWGTYIPVISGLGVDQRSDGFSVTYHAVCSRPGQEISFDASIEGSADGGLVFQATAVPTTDFLTARTGFVVLHPLKGVVGHAVEVEHVDGRIRQATFPELVDPVQPFLDIRSLAHEVCAGSHGDGPLRGRHLGDGGPPQLDGRVVQDVRAAAGLAVALHVARGRSGHAVGDGDAGGNGSAEREERGARDGGSEARGESPALCCNRSGWGMPPEEIDHALASIDLLRLAAPRFLQCQFDPRANHGREQIQGYRALCEETGAQCVLEVIVSSVEDYARELHRLAGMIRESGIRLSAVAVCPVGDLKSVLPGGPRPPAPPLDALYAAAREAFPGVRLGGGMLSFFTELNRKRPPAKLLDFVMNTTCPIVHAADDRSAMETLAALPYQVTTARSFLGATPVPSGPELDRLP